MGFNITTYACKATNSFQVSANFADALPEEHLCEAFGGWIFSGPGAMSILKDVIKNMDEVDEDLLAAVEVADLVGELILIT